MPKLFGKIHFKIVTLFTCLIAAFFISYTFALTRNTGGTSTTTTGNPSSPTTSTTSSTPISQTTTTSTLSSPTITTNSSTQVTPLSPSNPSPMHSEEVIQTTYPGTSTIENAVGQLPPSGSQASSFGTEECPAGKCGSYNALPSCPPQYFVNCPDINQKKQAITCPSPCTVDRYIETNQIGVVTQYLLVQNPICPTGYILQYAYNMQPEMAYNAGYQPPVPGPFDVPTFNDYIKAGYSCSIDTKNTTYPIQTTSGCSASEAYNPSAPPDPNYPLYDSSSPTSALNTVATINGYAGGYIFHYNSSTGTPQQCYWGVSSSTTCNASNPAPACSGASVSGSIIFTQYSYTWGYITCKPPPGLYPTANMIPASIVCTHVAPTWKGP